MERTFAVVVAVAHVAHGVVLAASDPTYYQSGTYDTVLELASRPVWAAAFVVAGVVYVVARRPPAAVLMLLVSAGWSVGLLAAALSGEADSPTAWIAWACLAALLAMGISRVRG